VRVRDSDRSESLVGRAGLQNCLQWARRTIARSTLYIVGDEEQRELDGHGGVIRGGLDPSIAIPPHFAPFRILSWAVAITQA
jgi:hypothetical protein